MKTILPAILVSLFAFAALAEDKPKAENVWTNDYAAALAQAEKEGKDVLLLFVGSDWCPVCKALMKDLEKAEINKEILKRYVPVIIDYPHNYVPPVAIQKQNEALGIKFGVSGVPLIVVLDSKGRAIGSLEGYDPENTDLIKSFDAFQKVKEKRDGVFKKAEAMNPADKARALNDFFVSMSGESGVFLLWSNYGYDEEIALIIAGDADNNAGVKICWEYRQHVIAARKATMEHDFETALKYMDEFIASYPEDKHLRQSAMFAKAQLLALNQNPAESIICLGQTAAVDPESEIGQMAKKALLEISKQMKVMEPGTNKTDPDKKEPLKEAEPDKK